MPNTQTAAAPIVVDQKVVVYRTPQGWRYRWGSRDDGNYFDERDAQWAGEAYRDTHLTNRKDTTS